MVPGSGDPFNGALQAGKGISKTLTDGNKFRVSPRVGFAYDITGKQRLVARGGLAVLYDRPEGANPTITNLPYDASGNLVNKFGVGTVSAVGPPRQLQAMTRFTF